MKMKANLKYIYVVLYQICETLRIIGTLLKRSYSMCILFNVYFVFFNNHCNSTVWTLEYAVQNHARYLDNAKEFKHSGIKQQVKSCTNRSKKDQMWHQIMQSSYVRNCYLPYYYPIMYCSHYIHINPKSSFV